MTRKRSEMVSVRLTADEFDAIRAAAAERGKSVSQFLRDAALRVATGPCCAHCGQLHDLAFVIITGQHQPTVHFGAEPFSITGPYRWAGWRCRACCLRDYGVFGMGREVA